MVDEENGSLSNWDASTIVKRSESNFKGNSSAINQEITDLFEKLEKEAKHQTKRANKDEKML